MRDSEARRIPWRLAIGALVMGRQFMSFRRSDKVNSFVLADRAIVLVVGRMIQLRWMNHWREEDSRQVCSTMLSVEEAHGSKAHVQGNVSGDRHKRHVASAELLSSTMKLAANQGAE